ncbi:MAG: hypothetical protein U0Q12_24140 [Vicinamibacterales bacterium]
MESQIYQQFTRTNFKGSFGPKLAGLACVALVFSAGAASAQTDSLQKARRFYNDEQYERAYELASVARQQTATRDVAALLQGRAGLEFYRQTENPDDLERARQALRSVNASSLSPRDRTDLTIGLAETLFFDQAPGAAAELFASVIDAASDFDSAARDQLLDWWATALDRHAQGRPTMERSAVYVQLASDMRLELKRNPASVAASYWLVVAEHLSGEFERAWDAAVAGWVRAQLDAPRGASLRPDLDKLMMESIIPEHARRLVAAGVEKDLAQAQASLEAEWERVKTVWSSR